MIAKMFSTWIFVVPVLYGFLSQAMTNAQLCDDGLVELHDNETHILTSPGYPTNALHNFDCYYELVPGSGYVIEAIIDIDTEPNDQVRVYDGATETNRYSGNITKVGITQRSNPLRIQYITDSSGASAGFNASYRQYPLPLCGSTPTATTTLQTITSPGYPHNYFRSMHCEWNINAPSGEQIQLTIFDLESENRNDVVKIYTGVWYEYSGTIESPITVLSWSNSMRVIFQTDSSVSEFRGFQAKFGIPVSDECSEGTHNCHANATCTDNIESFTCRCNSAFTGDGVVCVDIDECTSTTLPHDCDANAACTNNMGSFTCECNAGFNGDGKSFCVELCDDGLIQLDDNETHILTSPGYPTNALRDFDCYYVLEPESGYVLEAIIDIDTQPNDQVRVYDGATETNRYSGNITKVGVTQRSNPLRIQYITDSSGASAGFNATYRQYPLPLCGSTPTATTALQTITSPGYPHNYFRSMHCEWNINAPSGEQIQLTIFDLESENRNDVVKIYTGVWYEYSGTIESPITVLSWSNSMRVIFQTDSSVSEFRGFAATYSLPDDNECTDNTHNCHANAHCTNTYGSFTCACDVGYAGDGLNCIDVDECVINTHRCHEHANCTNTHGSFGCSCNFGFTGNGETCTASCGQVIQLTDTTTRTVTSPGYPNATHNLDCTYEFQPTAGYKIEAVVEIHTEPNDRVMMFDGDNNIGVFNGDDTKARLTSDSNSLRIQLVTDGSLASAGFIASIRQYEDPYCGYTITASTTIQTISSPTYPHNYFRNLNCVWNINAPPGEHIQLTLFDLELEQSHDRLEVSGGLPLASLAETIESPITWLSTGSPMRISFHTDSSVSDFRGFLIKYGIPISDECSEGTHNCHANATCTDNIESFTCQCNPGFTGDGVVCVDIDECTSTTLPHDCDANAACTNNMGSFTCECNAGLYGNGKTFCVELCDGGLIRLNDTDTHVLTSPGYPTNELHNFDCQYVFEPQDEHRIEVIIEVHTEENDYVSVYDGSAEIGRYNNDITRARVTSGSNSLRIHYVTVDSGASRGFRATYRQLEEPYCGFTADVTSTSQTVTSPGYPYNYFRNLHCVWVFIAPPGENVLFTITDLETEGRDDRIEIWSGGRGYYYGNITHFVSLISSGNRMEVRFITDRYTSAFRGFTANYHIPDVDECADDTHDCDADAQCFNQVGSFVCVCGRDGFTGNGRNCSDFDECASGSHSCHEHATCTNNEGSYDCECDYGYSGDGRNCAVIDECASGTHNCHDDATCTNTPGVGHACNCNFGFAGNGTSCIAAYEVFCLQESMLVKVYSSYYDYIGVDVRSLRLINSSCTGVEDETSPGVWLFRITDLTSCGNIITSNSTHRTYTNTLSNTVGQGVYTGVALLTSFSCSYSTDLNHLSLFSTSYNVVQNVANISVPSGAGQFVAVMDRFTDSDHGTPDIKEEYETTDTLFIQIQLQTSEETLNLVLDRCWVTPTPNITHALLFNFIQNQCPVPTEADGNVEITRSGNGSVAHFRSQVFAYTNYRTTYLHCALSICSSADGESCIPICLRRSKRSLSTDQEAHARRRRQARVDDYKEEIVSLGPFTVDRGDEDEPGPAEPLGISLTTLIAVATAFVVVIIACALLALFCFRRYKRPNKVNF